MPEEVSIKFHSFTTDPGFTPNYGDVSADFRGDKFIGSAQGDEHHTLMELKNPSQAEIDAFLVEGPVINAELKKLNLASKVSGILGTSSVAGIAESLIPNLRIGLFDAHA